MYINLAKNGQLTFEALKLRIQFLYWKEYRILAIVERWVLDDNIVASKQSVRMFLKCYKERVQLQEKKVLGYHLSTAAFDIAMKEDDE